MSVRDERGRFGTDGRHAGRIEPEIESTNEEAAVTQNDTEGSALGAHGILDARNVTSFSRRTTCSCRRG